ncbi:hypothetical protein POM88_006873 [Heracleum sosnowskyi]|uniref:Uncharacterized protein n=1 Tax=Heracleum sosnowskyi TaxID=360622 RepID=A0AAD8J3E1_9APIA|nr:hypothetical protein POM88_006873 [Heracleum sosnowskyi]
MSPTNRAILGIRQAIFAGSRNSPQSFNGFLGGVSFASVFHLPQARTIKEGFGDMLGGVGETAKSAVSGATETGRSAMESTGTMGEKGMHTADRTVNSAAETTKNISEKNDC